ncbi:MAG: Crp/Fnr family transcriptional regulator [Capsulimonadaceae bacterium]|nr:Crp/Fnr family transcriptional regulator [Capsulimonadaceae bacterium]
MEPYAHLRSVPLFAGLPDSDIVALAAQTRRRVYRAKQQILWRGEPGETLYVIANGRVKIHSATENGTEVTLAVLGPAGYFGELSVLDNSPRSADVTALVETECTVLDGAALHETILQHSDIGWRLLQHLATLVRAQNANIESLASRDVAGRVAKLLLQLSEQHGEPWTELGVRSPARQGIRIAVPLTKIDIATFVGATREHVTNIMGGFTRSGSIMADPDTGHIVVLKRDNLARRA